MIVTPVFRALAACGVVLLVGCASQPAQTGAWPWPDDPWAATSQDRAAGPATPDADAAIPVASADTLVAASEVGQSLVSEARRYRSSGDFRAAAQRLERAISISPRDPVVWFELARVRLAEQQWAAAENLAQRALEYSYAGDAVIPWCWDLIARSRDARGDASGAAEARRQARVPS